MAFAQELNKLQKSLRDFIRLVGEKNNQIRKEKLSKVKTVIEVSADADASLYSTHVLLASVTLTLPANPQVGDWITFTNRSGTTTGTIARNGNNIMGAAENMDVDEANARGTLVYVNSAQGWILT